MNFWCEVLFGDGDCINAPLQKLKGGRAGWVLVTSFQFLSSSPFCFLHLLFHLLVEMVSTIFFLQLSAIDVSARTTMKGAAKCDKHCDLQNSVNQQGFERILRFRDIPESMPASASASVSCCRRAFRPLVVGLCVSAVRFCAPRCALPPLMHEVHVAAVACD